MLNDTLALMQLHKTNFSYSEPGYSGVYARKAATRWVCPACNKILGQSPKHLPASNSIKLDHPASAMLVLGICHLRSYRLQQTRKSSLSEFHRGTKRHSLQISPPEGQEQNQKQKLSVSTVKKRYKNPTYLVVPTPHTHVSS